LLNFRKRQKLIPGAQCRIGITGIKE